MRSFGGGGRGGDRAYQRPRGENLIHSNRMNAEPHVPGCCGRLPLSTWSTISRGEEKKNRESNTEIFQLSRIQFFVFGQEGPHKRAV